MSKTAKAIGKPLDRVDGRLKVTGSARYAAEAQVPKVCHGVLITSTIGKGKIAAVETAAAEKSPGVLAVLTHRNAPRLPVLKEFPESPDPSVGRPLQLLQDDMIHHNGQPVAVVVAETLEQATHAATLIRVTYREERPVAEFGAAAAHAFSPTEAEKSEQSPKKPKKPADEQRGDADKALQSAEARIEQTYTIAAEHHNPMEMHATIAAWDGSKLTVYDKTQGVDNTQKHLAMAFGIPERDVRVVSPFVGSAFGSGLRVWPNTYLAALAARQVGRPVKLVLTRAQMFTMTGYRPYTAQTIALGADKQGKLTAIRHEAVGQTSTYEEYTETVLNPTRVLYACPNVRTSYRLAAMNVNTPTPMRGPGEATGVFALESALDELAVSLGIDPIELRLRNHADTDPSTGQPWSSKSLKECYQQGAQRFGWDKRSPKPQSMPDGRFLIGYGMATATWPTHRQPATVLASMQSDGSAVVQTASADIGPGTYTAMTQIAADALGLPVAKVHVELGDSKLPPAPIEGGSMTVASVGSAVHDAALALREKLTALARTPLRQLARDQIGAEDGRLFAKEDSSVGETYVEILKRNGQKSIEVIHESKSGPETKKFSTRAFGAQFVQVRVDSDLGTVHVDRVVGVFAAGRIINPKTARSQAIGGIVGGIGMALQEETLWDPRNARVVNGNFADYHVPVHADIPMLDAYFLEEEDSHVNPLGAKGIAELSLVGVAPAIANAVYHATGKRVRELPITLDKLL